MGSPCELRLYAHNSKQAEQVVAQTRAAIEVLEQRYSRYRPDSLTSRINASAGSSERVPVDDETAGLLDYAAQAWRESDGLFDITSGVLRRVWDFRSGCIPAPGEIDDTLQLIGWDKVEWRRPEIRLPVAGMQLDFGGFVKEYAVDVAVKTCREAGVGHGLVEMGGDIGVIGPHPDGAPWCVGIRHPRQVDTPLARVDVASGAIATSGDYERYIEIDGTRYCHILNPRTGWPVKALASVSVLAPACLLAGTASTVAMLKETDGEAWLDELGLPYLAVTAGMRISGTMGSR